MRCVVVVDATNLDNHLRFALQLIALGLPVVVALNMVDLAERDGLTLDPEPLARELGVPVVADRRGAAARARRAARSSSARSSGTARARRASERRQRP